MKNSKYTLRAGWRATAAAGVFSAAILTNGPAMSAEGICSFEAPNRPLLGMPQPHL